MGAFNTFFHCLILDARYEKVRHGGTVVACEILIATAVLPAARRRISPSILI